MGARLLVGAAPQILIFSETSDIHALAVGEHLDDLGLSWDIVETDSIAGREGLSWNDASPEASTVRARAGAASISAAKVIWWRRVGPPQTAAEPFEHPVADLINNDSHAALRGVVMNDFGGTWISHPVATQLAENKLLQLRVAISRGMRLPSTLVTQSPAELREFLDGANGRVVAKALRGSRYTHLDTVLVEALPSETEIRRCPTIYQHYVEGDTHLRVFCFGSSAIATSITSRQVDWRSDSSAVFAPAEIPDELAEQLLLVLTDLGLAMGVFDLKVETGGDIYWLEVNPQGQFLFAEAKTGVPIGREFARYLARMAHDTPGESSKPSRRG